MAIFFCLQKVSLGGTTTSFFALDLNLLAINVPQEPDPDFDPDNPFEFIARMERRARMVLGLNYFQKFHL